MIRFASVCAGLILFVSVAPLPGQERRAPKELDPEASCVTKECHSKQAAGAVVHEPVAEKTCDSCHDQEDETLHVFELVDEGSALCYGCHKSVTKKKKFTHAPLKDKKKPCLRCHDAHSTASKHLIKAKTATDQCLECHTDLAKGPRYHKSGDVKECGSCHTPHASNVGKLLRTAPPELCFSCHKDIKQGAASARYMHGPLAVGCNPCHDSHRPVTGVGGLKKGGAGLCVACHEHFEPTVSAMSKHHSKLLTENDCRRCHNPHFSDRKFFLIKPARQLCLDCHRAELKTKSGRKIKAMEPLAKETNLHAPLAKDGCGGCHQPHGNEQFGFLRKSYPGTFYSSYKPETYALCFDCHKPSLAADSRTATATKFRNGNLNLHYLHVNKPGKGRTCRACHAAHGTQNTHMLTDSVSFGSWEIPIGYKETKNGGTCESGCHLQMSYDREKPIKQGTTKKLIPVPSASKGAAGKKAQRSPPLPTESRKPTPSPASAPSKDARPPAATAPIAPDA